MMEEFVGTLTEAKLCERLMRALRGHRPFRHFKDVLLDHPEQRAQWFALEREAQRARIERWLQYVFGDADPAEEGAADDGDDADDEYPPLRLEDEGEPDEA